MSQIILQIDFGRSSARRSVTTGCETLCGGRVVLMSLARSGSSALPRHPIRRKIRFQLVCSVLRASPAALRGHNGVLDSVGICRGRRSSAVRSVVLLAHCRPASPSEWPGLCARQSESRTRFRGHPSRLKPYGRTRIRWYEHLNSLTRAHNHPWQTRHSAFTAFAVCPTL